jgi:RNA chaperone Hfq
MGNKNAVSLEQQYLDSLVGEEVKVFIVSGKALTGRLEAHDDDVILLERAEERTLTFKHHITTVMADLAA